jgi:hypothetical protein
MLRSNEYSSTSKSTMAKKKRLIISPEERADWDAARRQLEARLEAHEEFERLLQAREDRRRRRLRRLSFGLLGRA